MAERNTDRIRYRYGICLNDNCEKCKSKEVQEIPARKDFVCQNPECGKPLRECPPPKKGGNTKLIGIIAGVVVLLAIIGGIIAFSGDSEDKPAPASVPEVTENTDSIKAAQEAAEQQRIKDSLDAVAAAEAAKKPQVHFADPELVTVTLGKIACFIKESDEYIHDYPFLASAINGRLLYQLGLVEQNTLVSTLLGTSGIQTDSTSWTAQSEAIDIADLILDAAMDVQDQSGFAADGIVINPATWYQLRVAKKEDIRSLGLLSYILPVDLKAVVAQH